MQGYVTHLKLENGYGFIQPKGSNHGRVFFHVRALRGLGFDERLRHRLVEFDLGSGPDGRARAERVRPPETFIAES